MPYDRQPRAGETITGTIDRIIFANEVNGFAVLSVCVSGQAAPCTVVGQLLMPREGDSLRASGRWMEDARRGRQFKADVINVSQPTTREGIIKYLSSGAIKGIKNATAEALYERFGDKLFDVIDTDPNKLRGVARLGKKSVEKIRRSWTEQRAAYQALVFLQQHGIGAARAARAYKQYGQDTIRRVSENPWSLARDVEGFGFATADELARRLGVDRRSPFRAMAGLHHVLDELSADGHCAYPEAALIQTAARTLGIDADILDNALRREIAERWLVRDDPAGEPWIYRKTLHEAEVNVASRLRTLLDGVHPLRCVNAVRAVEWVQGQIRLELAAAQQLAVATSTYRKVLVITGGPGVGKTTIVNAIIRIFEKRELAAILCAPTGRAAKRLAETTGCAARTVHRLLEYNANHNAFMRNADRPLEGGLLICDEASMMDIRLMSALLDATPDSAALLLVGDVDQLPSVGPGQVLADVINSGATPTVRLTHIFRQGGGSRIVEAAHAVNRGDMPELAPTQELSDFYFVEADDPNRVQQIIVELVTRRIPARFGFDAMRDVQVLTPMNKHALGARHLSVLLQEALNPPSPARPEMTRLNQVWRVGDKVMQIANNYDNDLFNGDVGYISEIKPAEGKVVATFDGRPITYTGEMLGQLMIAYAVSIHKSQGSEYPAVVVALHDSHYVMLQRNLLYTAMTRGKKLVVIVGSRSAMRRAVERRDSAQRFTALHKRLINSEKRQDHAAEK